MSQVARFFFGSLLRKKKNLRTFTQLMSNYAIGDSWLKASSLPNLRHFSLPKPLSHRYHPNLNLDLNAWTNLREKKNPTQNSKKKAKKTHTSTKPKKHNPHSPNQKRLCFNQQGEVVIMGGAFGERWGNRTPAAEANFFDGPEAAQVSTGGCWGRFWPRFGRLVMLVVGPKVEIGILPKNVV